MKNRIERKLLEILEDEYIEANNLPTDTILTTEECKKLLDEFYLNERIERCKKSGEMPDFPMYPPTITGVNDHPDLMKVIINALGDKGEKL